MTKPTTKPAKPFQKPDYWSDSPPPAPAPPVDAADPDGLSPTRYGDWTLKGIAVDF